MLVCGDVDGRILRAYRPLVHRDLCVRCGTCADFCQHGSIRRRSDGTLHTNLQACMGCGLCSRVCPEGAIEMTEIGGILVLA